jgi:xanthine dehydrogenase accessory factor
MKEDQKPVRILVRGSNDIGSAVAHRLFSAGYPVVIHDIPQPAVTRRKMAFTDAIFDGRASLEGVRAVRIDDLSLLEKFLAAFQSIPVVVEDFSSLIKTLQPAILVDARMRKRQQPKDQRGLAPLTIGLGPNFIAGENIDVAIETSWGAALGQVIYQGATLPLRGEPRPLAGHARDRYVYAPAGGVFSTALQVGDTVRAGQVVAWVNETPLHAPLSGRLRGLTHTGVPVKQGTKVIEVDPRGESVSIPGDINDVSDAEIAGIAKRPRRIAEGVLRAVQP